MVNDMVILLQTGTVEGIFSSHYRVSLGRIIRSVHYKNNSVNKQHTVCIFGSKQYYSFSSLFVLAFLVLWSDFWTSGFLFFWSSGFSLQTQLTLHFRFLYPFSFFLVYNSVNQKIFYWIVDWGDWWIHVKRLLLCIFKKEISSLPNALTF